MPATDFVSPVLRIDESDTDRLNDGIGLCLSGGGYRAMLFHVGALWRLVELGLLPKVARISTVPGANFAPEGTMFTRGEGKR